MNRPRPDTGLKELSLVVADETNPFEDLAKKHNATVALVGCRMLASKRMALVLEVEGGDPDRFLCELRSIPGMKRAFRGRSRCRSPLLVLAEMEAPVYCTVVHASGALCVSCPFGSTDGVHHDWRILVGDPSVAVRTLDMLRRSNGGATVTQVLEAGPSGTLTPRQRQVVLAAVRAGYFEFPRRTSLTALAGQLSIKPSTLSEILRRAEDRMAKEYVESVRFAFPPRT